MSEKQKKGPMTLDSIKLTVGSIKAADKDHKPLIAHRLDMMFVTTPLLRKQYSKGMHISILKGARPEHIAAGFEALAAELRKKIPDIGEPVVHLVDPGKVPHET